MIDKKIIIKRLRDLTSGKQSVRDHNIMHPEREWFIGSICVIVLLCGGIFWSIQEYRFYNEAEQRSSSEPTDTPPVIYREQAVAEALTFIADRAKRYEQAANALRAEATGLSITPEVPTIASSTELTPDAVLPPASSTPAAVIIPRTEITPAPDNEASTSTAETPALSI